MSVGTGRQNIIILFWKYQFHFREYINGNQTFILDSHRPFICSAEYLRIFRVVGPCSELGVL
jgi:hypothetical protein